MTRQGVASQAAAKTRRFIFFGALASGEGINPFFFCDTQDSKNLENIRENASPKNKKIQNLNGIESVQFLTDSRAQNLGSAESKEILNNKQKQNLGNIESTESSTDSESKTFTESSAEILKDAQLIESSHIDSATFTESKEILKNEKIQNLGGTDLKVIIESNSIDSQDSQKQNVETNSLDSESKQYRIYKAPCIHKHNRDLHKVDSKTRTESMGCRV